jgi:hypothetical protein
LTGKLTPLPVVYLDEREHQQLQARNASLEQVRAQETVGALVFNQLLDVPFENAYQPTSLASVHLSEKSASAARSFDDPVFRGVYSGSFVSSVPNSYIGAGYGLAINEYTWTLPENAGTGRHLLVVGDPDQRYPEFFGGDDPKVLYLETPGDQITLKLEVTEKTNWSVRLNGEVYAEGTAPATDLQYIVFSTPILQSSSVGEFNVDLSTQYSVPGRVISERQFAGVYTQKKLTFAQSFPTFSPDQTESVEFFNTIVWSDGGALETPVWEILGEDDEVLASGTSSIINATWNPLADSGNLQEGVFIGVPVGVRIKALAYKKNEFIDWDQANSVSRDVDYEVVQNFGPPGELKIINLLLNPEIPFQSQGDSVEMTADIVAVGMEDLTDEDIKWWVELIRPDGQPATRDPIAQGVGFRVEAEWDGTIEGVPVENPGSYSFDVRAATCSSGSIAPQQVRGQQIGEQCSVAQIQVPIGIPVSIEEVTFAGNREGEKTANGPYEVYDYINRIAPNDQPHWKRDGNALVPGVMKAGEDIYAIVKFNVTDTRGDFDEILVTVRQSLPFSGGAAISYLQLGRGVWNEPQVIRLGSVSTVGRWPVTIDFKVEIETRSGATGEIVLTAPGRSSGKKLRLYTVFGPQPEETQNTSNVAGGEFIWYHPDRFEDDVPVSGPGEAGVPTRSPLDLATHWASGIEPTSANYKTAIKQLAEGLYRDGGYKDYSWTKMFDSGQSSLQFYEMLANDQIECPDVGVLLKVLSNGIGIPARTRRFEDAENLAGRLLGIKPKRLFSVYLRPIGVTENFNDNLAPDLLPPKDIAKTKFLDSANGCEPADKVIDPVTDSPIPAPGRTFTIHQWVQFAWEFHMVTDLDGTVVDGCAKVSDVGSKLVANPDYFLNQLNVNSPAVLEWSLRKKFSYFAPPALLENTKPDFGSTFSPVEESFEDLPYRTYLAKLLYGYLDSETLRATKGYNDFDFASTSIVIERVELVR